MGMLLSTSRENIARKNTSSIGRGRVSLLRALALLLLGLLVTTGLSHRAHAQGKFPIVGRDFTFGIIEGADNSTPGTPYPSDLYLTVVSHYTGCGIITTASGYTQVFDFVADQPHQFLLDHSLMQLLENGKSGKGLMVHTSQPVSLTLHDWALSAGDATQIYPDEALDTAYVVGGWGLYNDFGEDNRSMFVVAANQDNTVVTITPAVQTLLAQPAKVPFTVTLQRGESYIVKADIRSLPTRTSLVGSLITSTKPVSVITGVTCGYVPLDVQSCNQIQDMLLGKKWWGKHFLVQPLGNGNNAVVLMLSSDRDFIATFNGSPNLSNGQPGLGSTLQSTFNGPGEIITSEPVQVQQLTQGNTLAAGSISDPTLITVLTDSLWSDTLLFNTPKFNNSGFANWVPVIFPTARMSEIKLDGLPLSNFGSPIQINATAFSTLAATVYPGLHSLFSPVPVFAQVTGFGSADAYSFLPGGIGIPIKHDTVEHNLLLRPEQATTCSDFGVLFSVDTPFTIDEAVSQITIPIRYDSDTLSVVRLQSLLGPGVTLTADSSTPGLLLVTLTGSPYLTGKDLFNIYYIGKAATASTVLNGSISILACSERVEKVHFSSVAFPVAQGDTTVHRAFSLASSQAAACNPVDISITTDQIVQPSDLMRVLKVEVLFDPTKQTFQSSQPGPLLAGTSYTESGGLSGAYQLVTSAPQVVSGSDWLLTMRLVPTVTSTSLTVNARVTLLMCSDTIVRMLTLTYPIAENVDSTHAKLALTVTSVSYGNQSSADVMLAGLPIAAHVKSFDLYFTYNHNVLTYTRTNLQGTLASGWTVSAVQPIDATTDKLTFTSPGSDLGISGTLAHVLFQTFVADSASTEITISSSLPSQESCPLTYRSTAAQALFVGKDLCGDPELRALLQHQTIRIQRAAQSATGGIGVHLLSGFGATVRLTVLTLLGEQVAQFERTVTPGANAIELPVEVASGAYIVRCESPVGTTSKKVMVVR